jgi:hypothetical protein
MMRKEMKSKAVGDKKSEAATPEVESKSTDERQCDPFIADEETSAGGDMK